MATVLLPRSLVEMFPGVPRRLDVPAETVAALIAGLDARWPGMADRLCEPGPRIRPFINVFVDGRASRARHATSAPTSLVHIIPAVAGGCATLR